MGEGELRRIEFQSESYASKTRYVWGDVSHFELALSLRKGSYLTHGTASFLHGLNDRIPRTIYVNVEQSSKERPSGSLTQAALDRAFAGRQRTSKYAFQFDKTRAILLSGKNTGKLGVELLETEWGRLPVTSIERTLIDIVVRPAYSGGVYEILESYRGARQQASIRAVLDLLQNLDYVYPYHQSIGYLMEKAGYEEPALRSVRELGMDFDFYLTHGMKKTEFVDAWRLFVPQGF